MYLPSRKINVLSSLVVIIMSTVLLIGTMIQTELNKYLKTNVLLTEEVPKNVTYILLWTQIRSGSRFTATLLAKDFDVHYVEEPLADLFSIPNAKSVNISKFLFEVLACEYDKYPEYLKMKYMFFHNNGGDIYAMSRFWNLDRDMIAELDQSLCKSSKFRLARIVVPSLKETEVLLNTEGYNLKVILLSRDPRATSVSRTRMGNVAPYYKDPCERLEDDLTWYLKLKTRFPNKLTHIYFEYILQHPQVAIQKLYNFTGLRYTLATEDFLMDSTLTDEFPDNYFALRRNSAKIVNKWRSEISFKEVEEIQNKCRRVMNDLGYRIFKDENELKNFSFSNVKKFVVE